MARNTSSLVIDKLCDQAREESIAVAWMYCDYNLQQDQTVVNIMGAILRGLVGWEIPEDIRRAFQEGRRPLLADLMGMLRIAIAKLPQIFICIDALDECLPKDLPQLLESLRDIVRESPGTRIFLTGRPHVGEVIDRSFTRSVTIRITPNEDDIRNYLEMRLNRDEAPEAMDNGLRAEIVRIIVDKMSNMYVGVSGPSMMYIYQRLCRFILASLIIEAILGEETIGQRRKRLNEMARGNGLSDAYTATLTRLKAQNRNKSILGQKALIWVSHSERPLGAEELCHALGVEIGSTDLDPESIPPIRTLLSSCLGLLTIEGYPSTVRLVHFTLQEHLSNDPTQFHCSHSTIAEICLTYLNFGSVRDLSPTLRSAPSTMPLLQYASLYWGEHTRMGMTESIEILALRLLDRFDEHISAQLLLLHYNRDSPYPYGEMGSEGFTGLHGAALLGIADIFSTVLDMKEWDINASSGVGLTAIALAAESGQEGVVEILLRREDINPDNPDAYGQTPLFRAASNGHERVVEVLLERDDVNHNKPDDRGQTPLYCAASTGHKKVVETLLRRDDVNPNKPDNRGQTPLFGASWSGHEGVVKILLERKDARPEEPDSCGQTPLFGASWNGHEGVVKTLLELEGVNPNKTDTRGQTPLFGASWSGHEGVVEILLGRADVNPNKPDNRGQTPLYCAARTGHEGVVKILLGHDDVNPDKPDVYGQTPLFGAASNGHERVVEVLLRRDDVNPGKSNKYGQTPLFGAAWDGHEGVVKILLGHDEVNPDTLDKSGRTPLWWAAKSGHVGVVALLQPLASAISRAP